MPNDYIYAVTSCEKKLGNVRAILTGDVGDVIIVLTYSLATLCVFFSKYFCL